jgi:hypothetical protein
MGVGASLHLVLLTPNLPVPSSAHQPARREIPIITVACLECAAADPRADGQRANDKSGLHKSVHRSNVDCGHGFHRALTTARLITSGNFVKHDQFLENSAVIMNAGQRSLDRAEH